MNATEREIAADVTLNGRLLLAQEKTFSISYAPWYGRRRAFKAVTTPYPQKITFGEMRASGVRDMLVYCRDHRCSHHIAISADRWPLVAPKNKSLARSNKTRMRVPC
jgi:hypothetical protein